MVALSYGNRPDRAQLGPRHSPASRTSSPPSLTRPTRRCAISPDASAALATQDRLLPVFDGLDEVPPQRRAAIITALNASLTAGVILASHRGEYRTAITEAGDVLTAAATVGPYTLHRRGHLPAQVPAPAPQPRVDHRAGDPHPSDGLRPARR